MNQASQANFAAQPTQGVWTQVDTFSIRLKHSPQSQATIQVILVVNDQNQFINLSAFYQSINLRLKTFCQSYKPEKKEEFKTGITQLINEIVVDAPEINPEVLVTFQVEQELIAVGVGGGSVLVVRNKDLGKVMDSASGITLVNGKLEYGDLVLVCSNNFYNLLPYQVLKQILVDRVGGFNLDNLVSELVVFFKRQPSDAGVAFAISQLIDPELEKTTAISKSPKLKLPPWITKYLKIKTPDKAPVYVKEQAWVKRKKLISYWGLVAILFILVISLTLGRWRQRQLQIQTEITQKTQPIIALQLEAESNLELNPLKARSLLQQGLDLIAAHKATTSPESKLFNQLDLLEIELADKFQTVAAEHQVQLNQFMNLEFIQAGFFGERLGLLEDQIIILDSGQDQLVTLGLVNKNPSSVIKHPQFAGGLGVTGAVDQIYVLGNNGIVDLDLASETVNLEIPTDPDWQNPVGFGAFAGNLYILDSQVQELWRYRGIVNGEYVRQRWLSPGVNPDFSQVVDMVIDGDIWVLNQDGGVRKYANGVGEEIPLVGLTDSIEAKSLGVNQEQIVILDQRGHRIVVFDKEGTYQKQFLWDQSILITDMVVWQNNAYLLGGSILYNQPL